jgi:hypothetical protein
MKKEGGGMDALRAGAALFPIVVFIVEPNRCVNQCRRIVFVIRGRIQDFEHTVWNDGSSQQTCLYICHEAIHSCFDKFLDTQTPGSGGEEHLNSNAVITI